MDPTKLNAIIFCTTMQQLNNYYSNIVIGIPGSVSFDDVDWSSFQHYRDSSLLFSILSDDTIEIIDKHDYRKSDIAPMSASSQEQCVALRKRIDSLFSDSDHFRRQYIVCGPGTFENFMSLFTSLRDLYLGGYIEVEEIANVSTNEDILYVSLG